MTEPKAIKPKITPPVSTAWSIYWLQLYGAALAGLCAAANFDAEELARFAAEIADAAVEEYKKRIQ